MRVNKQARNTIFAGLLCALCASVANAAVPALSFVSGGVTFQSFDTDETIGWRFSVTAPVVVTALGWWDSTTGTPLSASHQVGLWNDGGGAALTSTTVLTNSPLTGDFRYSSISPFMLGVGTYRIGGRDLATDGDNYAQSAASVATHANISFIGDVVSANGSGFAFPLDATLNFGRFGPNMLIAAVPEPSTYALMLVGLGFVGWVARRNRKSQQVAAV